MQMLSWQNSFHFLRRVELWHGATNNNEFLMFQQRFQLVTRPSPIKKRVCRALGLLIMIMFSPAHFQHELSLLILARVQSPWGYHLLFYSIKKCLCFIQYPYSHTLKSASFTLSLYAIQKTRSVCWYAVSCWWSCLNWSSSQQPVCTSTVVCLTEMR